MPVQRTDTVRQSDDDRVSRNIHLSGRQTDGARYTYSPDFPVLEYKQRRRVLWRKLWMGTHRLTNCRVPTPSRPRSASRYPEMGFPDTACVAFRLSKAVYRPLFELVGVRIPHPLGRAAPRRSAPAREARQGSRQRHTIPSARRTAPGTYLRPLGQSISKYERSNRPARSLSKFDVFLAGKYTLTSDEAVGYTPFKGKPIAIPATSTEDQRH